MKLSQATLKHSLEDIKEGLQEIITLAVLPECHRREILNEAEDVLTSLKALLKDLNL